MADINPQAFRPAPGGTVSRTVTTTSAQATKPQSAAGATSVRVAYTLGTASARIRSGGASVAATAADMLCPNPGTPFVYAECFSVDPTDTTIAAITDSGTCTVEFTWGWGQ